MQDGSDFTIEKQKESAHASGNALSTEAADELASRARLSETRTVLADAIQHNTVGTRIGSTDPNAVMSATIMIRSRASEKELDATLKKVVAHEINPLSAAEFNAKFGTDPQAMERVKKFAKDNGLTVSEAELDSGRLVLKGKVANFSKAFSVPLDDYKCDDGSVVRQRSGVISVPRAISNDVQAVLGLDTRPTPVSFFRKQDEKHAQFSPRTPATPGFMPNQVADAYDFPKESMGAGQSVAIIELNGGLDLAENEKYYKEHNLPLPKIQIVELNGGKNKPGGPDDSEVVLDSQVIGAIAPEANQQLIFANRSDQGFVDAILRATFAHEGEIQNSAISISWGARESAWDPQALRAMDLALKKAALKGITVFAAAGDAGAADLNPGQHDDGKFVADFPASDPWVTATGGTRMTIDASTGKPVEVVWNDSPLKTTGGGISQLFDVPDYQKDLKMPSNPKPFNPDGPKVGRGAPDIAGNASPATGFIIRLNGKDVTSGGTSAVAPLYAALMMRVNSILKRPAGFINPFLYKNAGSPMFNDIVVGNNNGFEAGPGWDAATGLGSLRGREFLKRLQEQAPPAATRLA